MSITTHVLDTALGRPAVGVMVALHRHEEGAGWVQVGAAATDEQGRVGALLADDWTFEAGTYRLTFATGLYFSEMGLQSLYPEVSVVFDVRDASGPTHVPLLLSPYGYTTHLGS